MFAAEAAAAAQGALKTMNASPGQKPNTGLIPRGGCGGGGERSEAGEGGDRSRAQRPLQGRSSLAAEHGQGVSAAGFELGDLDAELAALLLDLALRLDELGYPPQGRA